MEPVKSTSLAQAVIEEILSSIRIGSLKPGDTLPSQRELSNKLKVGRSCVREALQALGLINIIETRAGKKSVISNNSVNFLLNPIRVITNEDNYDLIDILEVRIVFETQIAGIAAVNATQKDFDELKMIVDLMESFALKNDISSLEVEDYRFHEKLAKSTNNKLLVDIFYSITELIKKSFKFSKKTMLPDLAMRAYRLHKKIYEKVKERNMSEAANAMLEHLEDVKKIYSVHQEKT